MEITVSRLASPAFWESERPEVLLAPHARGSRAEIEGVLGADGALVFQTSGSSGSGRFVCHTREGLLASAEAVNRHLSAQAEDVWLCPLPLYHVGGFGICARAFVSGSTAYEFDLEWGAERFCAACSDSDTTLTSLVPTQVFDLVAAGCPCPASLRAVLIGGGALQPDLEIDARELGWPLVRTYGLTEAGSQVATQRGEGLRILPHLQADIGERGCLRLRGASIAQTVLECDPGGAWLRRSCVGEDGWFQTDDRVEIDGECMRFISRASSHVKVLGELVDLDAVERAILQRVSDPRGLALIDLPDARAGNALCLAHELSADAQELQAIVQVYNASAPGFERIARCVGIDRIPRGDLGKIRRGELRRLVIETGK